MNNLDTLSITSSNLEYLQNLFGEDPKIGDAVNIEGVQFVYESSRMKPGITSTELIVNIAISFGTGIPASLVANMIWQKLAKGTDVKVKSKKSNRVLIKREDYEALLRDGVIKEQS